MVSVFDRGFLFGDSVYETIACMAGASSSWPSTSTRLERSARRIYLDPPPRHRIEQAMRETAAATGRGDGAGTRDGHAWRGGIGHRSGDGHLAAPDRRCPAARRPDARPCSKQGVAVEVVQLSRCAPGSVDPTVKSGNYLNSVLAIAEARRESPAASEAILCSANGSIAEGATSNVFLVADGDLAHAGPGRRHSRRRDPRQGADLARGAGIDVREPTFVAPEKLRGADEVFLTSAVRGILPVTTVDGGSVGRWPARPGHAAASRSSINVW